MIALTTGFCGTPWICKVLDDLGRSDLALVLLTTSEKPSLGYMVRQGATTVWERWDSDTAPADMNSRNHFAFGSMTRWLFEGTGRRDAGAGRRRPAVGRAAPAADRRGVARLAHAAVADGVSYGCGGNGKAGGLRSTATCRRAWPGG